MPIYLVHVMLNIIKILVIYCYFLIFSFFSNNNLVRYWILRVILDSEQQLRKVVNIDEVVKRVFVVLQSNDPIARVLTLRLLGAMAHIIAERSDVHHGYVLAQYI